MKRITFTLFVIFLMNISFLGCSNSGKKKGENLSIKANNKSTSIAFQKVTFDLFNFRINKDEPTKIYFDSKRPISSVNIENFSIKDNEGIKITLSTVNKKSTENHFLTVEKPFLWYHNNTISYLGDDNIEAFQLQFIHNPIEIPKVTGKEYYVNIAVSNSGDGLGESTAFKTIQEGIDVLTAGDKLWIKTGNYGKENIIVKRSGTSKNPIQIEGYIKTPKDISKMYFNYGDDKLDPAKMPLLDGGNRAKGIAFMLDDNVQNVVVKNIQITNYHQGFFGRVNTSKVRLERLLVKNMGDWDNGAKNGSGILLETWDNNKCNYFRVNNCIVINAENDGITSIGDNNYYNNCKVYSDEFDKEEKDYMNKATDYYFRIQGKGNIIRGCESNKKAVLGHYGHGFSMKYFNEYNLVENCKAVNILWAYQARHSACRFNVFRNSVAHANVTYRRRDQFESYTGGINVMCGANKNIFENIYIHDTDLAFDFYKNEEDNSNSKDIGHDNVFKNIQIRNIVHVVMNIRNYQEDYFESSFNNNKFYDIVVDKVNFNETPVTNSDIDDGAVQGGFFEWNPKGKVVVNGNKIKNSTIKNVPNINVFAHFPLPSGFIWENNKLENSFEIPQSMLKK